MTTEQTSAVVDLDLRIRRLSGTWRIEAKSLGMEATGSTYAEARDSMRSLVVALVQAFEQVAGFGLLAANARRLERLRALLEVLGPAAETPTK